MKIEKIEEEKELLQNPVKSKEFLDLFVFSSYSHVSIKNLDKKIKKEISRKRKVLISTDDDGYPTRLKVDANKGFDASRSQKVVNYVATSKACIRRVKELFPNCTEKDSLILGKFLYHSDGYDKSERNEDNNKKIALKVVEDYRLK